MSIRQKRSTGRFPGAALMEASSRIIKLREQTFLSPMMSELPQNSWGSRRGLALFEGWINSASQQTTRLRRSATQAHRLDHEQVVINDHELIVGCPDLSKLTEDEQSRLSKAEMARRCMPQARGTYDHMALDYEKLVKVGVNGLIAEIKQRSKVLNLQLPESFAKEEFYCGCLMELEALLRFEKRYAEQARAMAGKRRPDVP